MSRWLALVVCGGCAVDGPIGPHMGGQSGVANRPPWCEEDSRIAVTDPAVPAAGFDFSAADALDRMVGAWAGVADLDGSGDIPVSLDISQVGTIEAVLSHLEGADEQNQDEPSTARPGMGAPGTTTEPCPPTYDVTLSASLAAPPALSAEVATVWSVWTVTAPVAWFHATVPASDVTGTLTPPDWQNPEFWDREELGLYFSSDAAGTATLALDWLAINDDEPAPPTTTTGGAVVGIVEPSGTNEPIATVALLR